MITGNLDTSISLVVNDSGYIYYSVNTGAAYNINPCMQYANNIIFTDKSTVICGYFPNAYSNPFLHTMYNSDFTTNAQIEFDLFYIAGDHYNVIPYPTSIPATDAYIYITNGTNQPDDINKIYMGFSTAYPHVVFNIVPDTNVQIGFFSSMPVNFQIANPVISYFDNNSYYGIYQESISNITNNIYNNSLDLKNNFNLYNNIYNTLINTEGNTDLTSLNSSLNTLYNNVNNASNTLNNIGIKLFDINSGLITQFVTLGKIAYNLQNEIDLLQENKNTIINNITNNIIEIENINNDIISFDNLFTSFMTESNSDINNINNSITNLGDIGNIPSNANYPTLFDVNNVVNNVTSSISSTQSSMISLVSKLKNKN
jgi:hypothetical protein